MKILQIGSSLRAWGGIERYIAYLSDGLIERGHQVEATCRPGSPLESHLNIPTIPINVDRKLDFVALSKYLRLFRSARYDVVHFHFSPDLLLPAIAARITKQPFSLMTRHLALPWSPTKVRLYDALFDHFIPVSNAVQRHLEASGVPRHKLTVAKAGCPPLSSKRPRNDTRSELGIGVDQFAIGFFGRLVAEKGVETLIDASPSTSENVSFEVFGAGPLSERLEKKAYETRSRVRFHGFREDVPECLQAIDAVVIPSVWEEPFPYAALEAMSVGRTLLASRVGGMTEIVEDGTTGYLFAKSDATTLAEMASRLAEDPETNLLMGLRAKEVHRSTYTIQKMAERIERVYMVAGSPG